MSTITEIEAAIERLPRQQVEQLAAWLEEFKARPQKPVEYTDLDSFIGTWQEDKALDTNAYSDFSGAYPVGWL